MNIIKRRWLWPAGALTTVALLLAGATPSMAQAGVQCIPENDILIGPLGGAVTDLTGALGGMLQPVALLMLILTGAATLVFILSKKAQHYMKSFFLVLAIIFGVIFGILLFTIIYDWANGLC